MLEAIEDHQETPFYDHEARVLGSGTTSVYTNTNNTLVTLQWDSMNMLHTTLINYEKQKIDPLTIELSYSTLLK